MMPTAITVELPSRRPRSCTFTAQPSPRAAASSSIASKPRLLSLATTADLCSSASPNPTIPSWRRFPRSSQTGKERKREIRTKEKEKMKPRVEEKEE
jgi:hypothetical protein